MHGHPPSPGTDIYIRISQQSSSTSSLVHCPKASRGPLDFKIWSAIQSREQNTEEITDIYMHRI